VVKRVVTLVLSVGIAIFQPSVAWADENWFSLGIHVTEDGVAVATADLVLPTSPEVVYTVLTDYPHWPDLFPQQPRINTIKTEDSRVIVDMAIPAHFLPIDLELVTETREIHPLRLETTLVRGDFDRYDWVWELTPAQDGTQTHATLILNVQPALWVPDWLMRWLLESELEAHFHKLRTEVMERGEALTIQPLSTGQEEQS